MHEPFGEWTRRERAEWKKNESRRHRRRGLLAAGGLALIIFAVVFSLASLRPTLMSVMGSPVAEAPRNETLRLTIPKMKRVDDIPVYTAAMDNTGALDAGAVHLKGTGFPWQRDSNVYIAGHRLGYPRTGSFLVFYDLNQLKDGDRVMLSDSDGKKYVYKVFEEITVRPDHTSVTEPVAGKNIVSLQACTLPNYSKRLIVQAELVDVVEEPKKPSQASVHS